MASIRPLANCDLPGSSLSFSKMPIATAMKIAQVGTSETIRETSPVPTVNTRITRRDSVPALEISVSANRCARPVFTHANATMNMMSTKKNTSPIKFWKAVFRSFNPRSG